MGADACRSESCPSHARDPQNGYGMGADLRILKMLHVGAHRKP